MTDQPTGKILSFHQGKEFYMRRAEKGIDSNDLFTAVSCYRKAYDSDPSDSEACLALAEVLCQMGLYEESNRLLFVFLSMFTPVAECFYGIACNFYGMNEFDYAAESLETYLQLAPDGMYAYDAEDFLDLLSNDDDLADSLGIDDDEEFDTLTICARAQRMIDSGCPSLAAAVLRTHLSDFPEAIRARNLLTTAEFCSGHTNTAKSENEKALQMDETDISARIQKAFLLSSDGDSVCAEAEIADIEAKEKPENMTVEQLIQFCTMQIAVQHFSEAQQTARYILNENPYHRTALHLSGYSSHLLRDDQTAADCYYKLLQIDPDDTTAAYYYTEAKKNGSGSRAVWSLPYRVPASEIISRLHEARDFFATDADDMKNTWENDVHIRQLIKWLFSMPDDRPKRSVLAFLGSIGDQHAEYMLRDILVRTDQSDTIKRDALGILKGLHAKEPFIAYLEARWIQGSVSMVSVPKNIPAAYRKIFDILQENIVVSENAATVSATALTVFSAFIHSLGRHYPAITSNQATALAAAIEFTASAKLMISVDENDLLERYKITSRRFQNAMQKLSPTEYV